jgi:uncharacterized protein
MDERVAVEREKIEQFCRKWRIVELRLFGSALRAELTSESDVDLLVAFELDAHWSLFDLVQMQDELKQIFGRHVDLISRRGIETSRNYLRRKAILSSAEVLYVA